MYYNINKDTEIIKKHHLIDIITSPIKTKYKRDSGGYSGRSSVQLDSKGFKLGLL